MAINNAVRRVSALMPLAPYKALLPFPDLTVTPEDRYELARVYAGLIGSDPTQLDQLGNAAVKVDSGTYALDTSVYFSGATSYAISPSVPSGWSFDTSTGILTVDSGSQSAGTYGPFTVTASNGAGSVIGNTFTVKLASSSASIDYLDFLE